MYKVFDNDSGEFLGKIDSQELMFLRSLLEEESLEDKDYAITAMTIAYFEEQNVDKDLVTLLKNALGTKEEVIIRWEKEE